jgi:hypothetical protein
MHQRVWLLAKVKVKVSPKILMTDTDRRVGVQVYLCLSLVLHEVGFQLHAPAGLPAGMSSSRHNLGAWVGLTADPDGYGEEKISYPTRDKTSEHLA